MTRLALVTLLSLATASAVFAVSAAVTGDAGPCVSAALTAGVVTFLIFPVRRRAR